MSKKQVLILGIGNILWADEGFGVRCVEEINRRYEFDDNVKLMDGGTQGIYLVQHVQAADILLVFDAIDYGLEPGTMKLIHDDDVPSFMGAKKMSLHQTGFQEVLSMAAMLEDSPERILLIGVQPVELEDFGGSLRAPVRAQIDPAITAAVHYLQSQNIVMTIRDTPLPEEAVLSPPELEMGLYETGRPDETQACRVGDDRVLNDTSIEFEPKTSPLEDGAMSVNVDSRRP